MGFRVALRVGRITKSHNNLYSFVCSEENLENAFRKARKGKSDRTYVKEFESDLNGNISQLKKELETQTYQPRPTKTFVIRDPKTRVITVPDFRERVVHHAICSVIGPIFEKSFIYDSYANRKLKGALKAIQRFDYFKRKLTKNGKPVNRAKSKNMVIGYALKCDIRHYFPSVDHEIMIRLIKKKIKDKGFLWLIEQIIRSHGGKQPGKGMPLGNLTSQYFANIYLNELDKFVKHKLKAKYYIRYLDDFLILGKSKQTLENYKKQIDSFLKINLFVEIHTEKSKIIPLHKGVIFLGFKVFYYHRLLKKTNLKNFQEKISKMHSVHIDNHLSYDAIYDFVESWLAHAKNANTYKLRLDIGRQILESFQGELSTKEINRYLKELRKS